VKHVRANGISTDPFDDFTQNVVKDAGEKMNREGLVNKFKLYWVFDTEPGKMIHALKMAEISGLAYFDNSVHLCIHPEFVTGIFCVPQNSCRGIQAMEAI